MTLEELERDVAELKAQMAGVLARRPVALQTTPDPYSRWWEDLGPPLNDEAVAALDEVESHARYFRQTGDWPPPSWKPGDPIPEPEHWK